MTLDPLTLSMALGDWARVLDIAPRRAREGRRPTRQALAMSGRLPEALALARQVTEDDAADADDWFRLAQILCAMGKLRDAAAAAARAAAGGATHARVIAIVEAGAIIEAGSVLEAVTETGGPDDGWRPPSNAAAGIVGVPWSLPVYRGLNGGHPLLRGLAEPIDYPVARPRTVPEPVPAVRDRMRRRLAAAAARLMRATGLPPERVLPFLVHRADILAVDPAWGFELHHTAPMALGDVPWAFHFEQFNSLCIPVQSWPRAELSEARDDWRLTLALLNDPSCRLILTHVKQTHDRLRPLLIPAAAGKLRYAPLRFKTRAPLIRRRPARRRSGKTVTVLFTAGFTQTPALFHARGGLDLMHAMSHLARRRSRRLKAVRWILRAPRPDCSPPALTRRIRALPSVSWRDGRLSDAAMGRLMAGCDVMALPSVTLHALSLADARRHGMLALSADAYAVDEFVRDGVDGLIVRRHRPPARFPDGGPDGGPDHGVFYREDARGMVTARHFPADIGFHIRFRAALIRVLTNRRLRSRLRRNAETAGRWLTRGADWAEQARRLITERMEGET